MYRLPRWCLPPSPLVGRDDVVARAAEAVLAGPVTLVGSPGVGATCTAGAVIERLLGQEAAWQFSAVRMDRSTRIEDVIAVLGRDVGALLPGDQLSVESVLRGERRTVILLDDADLAPDVAREAIALGPSCLWVATGRDPVLGVAIPVERLSAEEIATLAPPDADPTSFVGLPLLARFPSISAPGDPWAAIRRFPPDHAHLADLPMGIPDDGAPLSEIFRLPVDGRIVLRRSVREILGGSDPPTPASLATALRDRLPSLREFASDGPPWDAPEDLALLRNAAERLVDPELRALAAAAASRASLHLFQPAQALAFARRAQAQRISTPARALLKWAEADALLAVGSEEEAAAGYQAAAGALRDSGRSAEVALLARRCAERWIARGAPNSARDWLVLARSSLGAEPDRTALADVQRVLGDLSAQAGELIGAESLYSEAEALLASVEGGEATRAVLCVARSGLALSRGEFASAESLLDEAERLGTSRSAPAAAISLRRAEVTLRRGDREGASGHVQAAQEGYKRTGCARGLLLCSRLRGDLAAIRGDADAARAAWDQAISLCVRTRDLSSLLRVLRRVLALEREAGGGPHADEIEEVMEMAETASQAER